MVYNLAKSIGTVVVIVTVTVSVIVSVIVSVFVGLRSKKIPEQ
jgi:hypothetical protein